MTDLVERTEDGEDDDGEEGDDHAGSGLISDCALLATWRGKAYQVHALKAETTGFILTGVGDNWGI